MMKGRKWSQINAEDDELIKIATADGGEAKRRRSTGSTGGATASKPRERQRGQRGHGEADASEHAPDKAARNDEALLRARASEAEARRSVTRNQQRMILKRARDAQRRREEESRVSSSAYVEEPRERVDTSTVYGGGWAEHGGIAFC